jgi:predicted nucleic acid-binding protein
MRFDCIVDANVCLKLFLVEPLTSEAQALFAHLTDANPAQFYAPDLFYIECANILWKYAHHHGYDPVSASLDMVDILDLPINITPTQLLSEAALELALDRGIAAYDAAYVVLSDRLDLPLVTADERLVHRLQSTHYDVRWLGNWP